MGIEVDQLITLDDGKKYIVTAKTEYEGEKYFLVAGVLEDESDINNEFEVLKETIDGEESYVDTVTDEELVNKLIELFEVKEGE